jgi:hypothetical protein
MELPRLQRLRSVNMSRNYLQKINRSIRITNNFRRRRKNRLSRTWTPTPRSTSRPRSPPIWILWILRGRRRLSHSLLSKEMMGYSCKVSSQMRRPTIPDHLTRGTASQSMRFRAPDSRCRVRNSLGRICAPMRSRTCQIDSAPPVRNINKTRRIR